MDTTTFYLAVHPNGAIGVEAFAYGKLIEGLAALKLRFTDRHEVTLHTMPPEAIVVLGERITEEGRRLVKELHAATVNVPTPPPIVFENKGEFRD